MSNTNDQSDHDIAVIGMSCRFPGARNHRDYWQNLQAGHEASTTLDDDALSDAGVSDDDIHHPDYVKSGMFLDGVRDFDAKFFGFSPRDASILDPQHRHFLECAWEAFEDAGYDPYDCPGSVGVFAGSGQNAYFNNNVMSNPTLVEEVGHFLLRHTGNDKDFLSTRVSYLFNLRGPSVNVQTACSTSLVAVHLAVQSLLNGESDMVLAGGVTINLPTQTGYLYKSGEILSADGHCRPFDASGGGTVFSSGAGCVLLKLYDDAVADRDNIHAVIKGSAVNNDGSGKISYLAPSIDGQLEAIEEALMVADIEPASVGFIECHGTGTQMGDPIEVAALTQAYGSAERCALGSVKSNIGHADTAAGIASMIKVIGSLKHKTIPATLHFDKPNPELRLEDSPFYVNRESEQWASETPRRAGVSSLGVGGTNAHIILQESELQREGIAAKGKYPVLLSAKTESALRKYCSSLALHLEDNQQLSLEDITWTLTTGRTHFARRQAFMADSVQDVITQLDQSLNSPIADTNDKLRPVCYMFAGGGTQYQTMGLELYEQEIVYRDAVDQCLNELKSFSALNFKEILFPPGGNETNVLSTPSQALPALFITQYAQACLWQSWGVSPSAMIGHSMGENTAACVAGVFSLRDALGLVALRGELFEQVSRGGMISVSLGYEELKPIVAKHDLDIAAVNAGGLCVASGTRDKLDSLSRELDTLELGYQDIHIDVAAHSGMLEPILHSFREYLSSIEINTPSVPFVSNLTGTWITDAEATDPDYWVRHLRHTVQFSTGLDTLNDAGEDYLYLEVGPGKTLTTLAKVHFEAATPATVISMPPADAREDASAFMSSALTEIWKSGGDIEWEQFYQETSAWRVSLPTYAFDHSQHWVEPAAKADQNQRATDLAELCYQPVWQKDWARPSGGFAEKRVWLIADTGNVWNLHLADALTSAGANVEKIAYLSPSTYQINGSEVADLTAWAIGECAESVPDVILHTLAIGCADPSEASISQEAEYRCFYSILELGRALGNCSLAKQISLFSLTRQAQSLAGEHTVNPTQLMLNGALPVLQSEILELSTTTVDLPFDYNQQHTLDCLTPVLSGSPKAASMAVRGTSVYSKTLQPLPVESEQAENTALAQNNGVYLITGGHGGIGLTIAEALAGSAEDVSIALVSRQALPAREQWDDNNVVSPKIDRVRQIEKLGARVYSFAADLSDRTSVETLKTSIEKETGKQVNGIYHAAGVVRDSLIVLKTTEEVEEVFNAKVASTSHLAGVFTPETLDFMVLFSSISALTGLSGQLDYAAANSYLDGFAQHQASIGNRNVISINWPAWRETGLAVSMRDRMAGKAQPGSLTGEATRHPMLDVCTEKSSHRVQFRTLLSTAAHWVLDEHRLADGTALLPGSGFVELARAAYGEITGNQSITISDAMFLQPLIVLDDSVVEMSLELEFELPENDGTCQFTIKSHVGTDEQIHASGTITAGSQSSPEIDISSIEKRCTARTQYFDDEDHHPNLLFGRRWSSLKAVKLGSSEALIELNLDDDCKAEVGQFELHPALLDMATGGAQALTPEPEDNTEFYVPIEYGSLAMNRGIPSEAYSHVTLKDIQAEPIGTATFDIDITDASGVCCVSVRNFVMKKISSGDSLETKDRVVSVNPILERTLELGVRNEEALRALAAVVSLKPVPQVLISPYKPDHLIGELMRVQSPTVANDTTQQPLTNAHDADADPVISDMEDTLIQNDAIEKVVVRSFLSENGEKRLIAWFVCDDWDPITVSDFRRFAREVLPTEQLPDSFVELDEMPLDESGEIDRTALLDPFATVNTRIEPRTESEKALAAIWSEILGTTEIGIRDNFFDIGGHSLLSIRVIVKIRETMAADMDMGKMALLTLEQLAADIDSQKPQNPDNQADSTSTEPDSVAV